MRKKYIPPAPLRIMTPARARKETQLRETLNKIDEKRIRMCYGCGSNQFEHSHRLPKGQFFSYIAIEENIDRYCRTCHKNYEDGRIWLLDNGPEVMAYILKENREYFMKKLFQMKDRLNGETPPQWVQNLFNEYA